MRILVLILITLAEEFALAEDILEKFSESNRLYTADVYKELTNVEKENIVFSPLSSEIVLALTGLGARNLTSQELIKVLRLSDNEETFPDAFKSILSHVSEASAVEAFHISLANKGYVNENFKINENFKKICREYFQADIENINFSKNNEAATNINKWVQEKTQDKISGLISATDLSEDTKLILINAIYFNAEWAKKFHASGTEKRVFFKNGEEETEVETMQLVNEFNYYEDAELDAKYIELPYAGGIAVMTLVVPNQRNGLAALEKQLDAVFRTPEYTMEVLCLTMPKFSVEKSIEFNPILKNLGVQEAFSDKADFSGISDNSGGLYISKVIQKTFIDVAEKGTEAAASTAVQIVTRLGSSTLYSLHLVVDHPFIFYIRLDNNIIFAGRITSP